MSNRIQLCVAQGFAVLGLCALAGCSSEPSISAGPSQTPEERSKAFPVNYDEYAKIGYRLDWKGYPSITGSLPVQFMEPYSDIVVTLAKGSTVTILDAGTGSRRCSDQLATPLTGFVGIARDSRSVQCCSDADVYVIDPQTCNMVGRQPIGKLARSQPLGFENLLIVGTGDGELLAHIKSDAAAGVKAWGFAIDGAIERKPVLIGNVVGTVSQTGQVLFVDGASGALVGRNFIYAGLATDPVADDSLMYVASLDQSIYAFAPVGGTLLWRVRTASPLQVQPTVHAGHLYCTVPGQGLTAYDCATGQVLWKCKGFSGTIVGTNKKRLVGFDKSTSEAALIDAARGDVIERAKVPGVTMMKPDKFEDGNLYVVSESGVVAKFQER